MGLPATLPFKHGFGSYMSPAMQARYIQTFSQFAGAEMLAVKYELTKDELDDYALRSHQRASEATRARISVQRSCRCPCARLKALRRTRRTLPTKASASTPRAGIGAVKLLHESGRHTAATASQICDGAAALLVVNERGLKLLGALQSRWRACIR